MAAKKRNHYASEYFLEILAAFALSRDLVRRVRRKKADIFFDWNRSWAVESLEQKFVDSPW
jgi:hypothetical protein